LKKSTRGTIKFRGYCRSGGKTKSNESSVDVCDMKFTIYIQAYNDEDVEIKFSVETEGQFAPIQRHNKSRPITGTRIEVLRGKSKHEKPKKLYLDGFTHVEDFQFFHGNLSRQSLAVFQKIRIEALSLDIYKSLQAKISTSY